MVSEKQLSELFNHSGRLRMLSHRAGMMMTFISAHPHHSKQFLQELPVSLENFNHSFNKVHNTINDNEALTATLLEFSQIQTNSAEDFSSIIKRYQQSSMKLYQKIRINSSLEPQELQDFLTFFAGDLLATLNQMVEFFEYSLSKLADDKMKSINNLAKDITDSLEEVDQINLSTKILSFNANVEAARAGELGKGFAVVSQEMTQLSSQTKLVSERIKRSVGAFVTTLNSALGR